MANFSLTIASDIDYEDLIAEIYYNEEFCALVTQEDGPEKLYLQIQSRSDGKSWKFHLKDFESALQKAEARLLKLRRKD